MEPKERSHEMDPDRWRSENAGRWGSSTAGQQQRLPLTRRKLAESAISNLPKRTLHVFAASSSVRVGSILKTQPCSHQTSRWQCSPRYHITKPTFHQYDCFEDRSFTLFKSFYSMLELGCGKLKSDISGEIQVPRRIYVGWGRVRKHLACLACLGCRNITYSPAGLASYEGCFLHDNALHLQPLEYNVWIDCSISGDSPLANCSWNICVPFGHIPQCPGTHYRDADGIQRFMCAFASTIF